MSFPSTVNVTVRRIGWYRTGRHIRLDNKVLLNEKLEVCVEGVISADGEDMSLEYVFSSNTAWLYLADLVWQYEVRCETRMTAPWSVCAEFAIEKAKLVKSETSAIDAQYEKKRKGAEVSQKMYV